MHQNKLPWDFKPPYAHLILTGQYIHVGECLKNAQLIYECPFPIPDLQTKFKPHVVLEMHNYDLNMIVQMKPTNGVHGVLDKENYYQQFIYYDLRWGHKKFINPLIEETIEECKNNYILDWNHKGPNSA